MVGQISRLGRASEGNKTVLRGVMEHHFTLRDLMATIYNRPPVMNNCASR
jgi:hypothetical protein